jgi:hypothetical protein
VSCVREDLDDAETTRYIGADVEVACAECS